MRSVLLLSLAYLIGSIPAGYMIVRAKEGDDVRETGSGGTGATNVSRRAGKGAGLMTLVFDAFKGALAVFLAAKLNDAFFPTVDWVTGLAGVFAILGHIFPVWLRFRGGKGVATCFGVFLLLNPIVGLFALVMFALTFFITRYVSLSSLIAIASIPLALGVMTLIDPLALPFAVCSILCAGLVIFAHRQNISRLLAGTEPKFK